MRARLRDGRRGSICQRCRSRSRRRRKLGDCRRRSILRDGWSWRILGDNRRWPVLGDCWNWRVLRHDRTWCNHLRHWRRIVGDPGLRISGDGGWRVGHYGRWCRRGWPQSAPPGIRHAPRLPDIGRARLYGIDRQARSWIDTHHGAIGGGRNLGPVRPVSWRHISSDTRRIATRRATTSDRGRSHHGRRGSISAHRWRRVSGWRPDQAGRNGGRDLVRRNGVTRLIIRYRRHSAGRVDRRTDRYRRLWRGTTPGPTGQRGRRDDRGKGTGHQQSFKPRT